MSWTNPKASNNGFKKGNVPWNKGLKGVQTHSEEAKIIMSKRMKGNDFALGNILSEETRKKMSLSRMGEKNGRWMGKDVKYISLHKWIYNHYGKPIKCENLNCSKKSSNYQWSNISGLYLRERKDWQMLCVPCHKKYDKNK